MLTLKKFLTEETFYFVHFFNLGQQVHLSSLLHVGMMHFLVSDLSTGG